MLKYLLLKDAAGSSFSKKEKWLYALLACFFTTLYFRSMPVINNIFIGAIFLYSFYFNAISEKLRLFRQRPEIKGILFFYALNVLSALFSKNVPEGFSWLQIRLPLLLFPIGIGLIYINETLKDRILYFYICATTAAAAVCLAWALAVYSKTHDAGFLYNDSLSDAIGKQSIYFAMMINIAVFGLLYLLFKKSFLVEKRLPVFITILFLLLIHFLLASRAAIIILYTGIVVYTVYFFIVIRKRRILHIAGLLVAFLIIVLALFAVFPKTLNRFREIKYTQFTFNSHAAESHYNMQLTPEQWNGTNVRLAIWTCGWAIAKHHFITGVNLGDKQAALVKMYREKHFDFGIHTNKNMHNTYLDVLCSLGIVGLWFFLAGFCIVPLIKCASFKDGMGLFVIIAFGLSMITETYPDRSIGCVLFAFFLSFIVSYRQPAPAY